MANSNVTHERVIRTRWNPWDSTSINEELRKYGAKLVEEYKGTTLEKHWLELKDGSRHYARLDHALRGKGVNPPKWTDDRIYKQLQTHGIKLLEPLEGFSKKYWFELSDGSQRRISLAHALNGVGINPKRKKKVRWSEEMVHTGLEKHGAKLVEPFKNNITLHHKIELSDGTVKEVSLKDAINGLGVEPGCRCYRHTTESINNVLSKFSVQLEGEFKGRVNSFHDIKLSDGSIRNIRLSAALAGKGLDLNPKLGFHKDKPGILYYIAVEFQDQTLYKLGITTKTVEERYRAENCNYKIIFQYKHSNGELIRRIEQTLLKELSVYKYKGESPFTYTGTREIFECDILQWVQDAIA